MKRYAKLLSLVLILVWPAAHAAESRERQQLRRLQAQLQQLDAARLAAESARDAALADKEKLERSLAAVRKSQAAVERRSAAEQVVCSAAQAASVTLATDKQGLIVELDTARQALAERDTRLQQGAQALAQQEAKQKASDATLTAREAALSQCRASNQQLAGLAREVLQRYRDKRCLDAIRQAEPFTGLRRVEVENLLEAWRDRVDASVLPQPEPPAR